MTATTATGSGVTDLEDLAEVALLSEAAEIESVLREAEVHKLRIAYQWAIAHPAVDAANARRPALPAVLHRSPRPWAARARRRWRRSRPSRSPSRWAARPPPRPRCSPTRSTCTTGSRSCGTRPGPARPGVEGAPGRHAHPPPVLRRRSLGRPPDRGSGVLAQRCRPRPTRRRGRPPGATATTCADGNRAARAPGTSCSTTPTRPLLRHLRAPRHGRHPRPDPLPRRGLRRGRGAGCPRRRRPLGVRKAKALGVIADAQARLDLTALGAAARPRGARAGAARGARPARREGPALPPRVPRRRRRRHAPGSHAAPSRRSARPPSTSIREWAGRARVTVQPVLHVAADDRWSVDRHDPPPRMAEQVRLRDEACVFPWCGRSGAAVRPRPPRPVPGPRRRRTARPDLARPLAPLCRRHHRRQDGRLLELRTDRCRHLPLDRTRRTHRPRHPARHRRASLAPAGRSSRDRPRSREEHTCLGRSAQPPVDQVD